MTIVTENHGLLVQRACLIARSSRTTFYLRLNVQADQADADAPVIAALQAVGTQRGWWGFWECFGRLWALGHPGIDKQA